MKILIILRIRPLAGTGEESNKERIQEKVWSIDWEGRQMPLVVFSESSGFEMSEWVIQWSWSINANAIPLGNIHTVHDYFMAVGGNSLLPFDSMVSNENRTAEEIRVSIPDHQFSTGWSILPKEKEAKYLPLLIEAWPLPPKIANSEVNHTSPPVSYPEYGKYE